MSAEGLGHNGDTLHFHSAALREFGRRYAERFLEMTGLMKREGDVPRIPSGAR